MPSPELLLKIIHSLLAIFVVIIALLLFLFLVNHFLRVRLNRKHVIRLENRGNCRSLYALSVSSPEPGLRFSLLLQDKPLVEVQDEDTETFAPEPAEPAMGQVDPTPVAVKSNHANKPGSPAGASAVSTGKAAAVKVGTLASLTGALGRLLPGSLGAGLRAQSAQAREVQVKTTRATQAPQMVKGQVGQVQRDSGKLAGTKPSGSQVAAARSDAGSRTLTVAGSGESASSRVQRTRVNAGNKVYRVQSPELGPGQSFDLTLKIDSQAKRYPAGSFPYLLESQQVALDFPEISEKSLQRNGIIYFPAVPGWRYWLPGLANILLAFLGIISLAYAYLLIWR